MPPSLLLSRRVGSLSKRPIITDPLHVRPTATFPMAQTPLQGVSHTRLGFTPQTLLCSLLSTEDDHFGDNSRVYGGEDPYSDPALYQSTYGGHSPCPSPLTVHQPRPCISTDIMISVHSIVSSSYVAPQTSARSHFTPMANLPTGPSRIRSSPWHHLRVLPLRPLRPFHHLYCRR